MKRKLKVVIKRDEKGYNTSVPELKGCHSQGKTIEEAIAKIKEAAKAYLEKPKDDEDA